jgi:hypothetical protein
MFDVRCSSKMSWKVLNTFRSKRESEKVLCDRSLQFIVRVFKLLTAANDFRVNVRYGVYSVWTR